MYRPAAEQQGTKLQSAFTLDNYPLSLVSNVQCYLMAVHATASGASDLQSDYHQSIDNTSKQ